MSPREDAPMRARTHGALWLAVGLWSAGLVLDSAVLAYALSAGGEAKAAGASTPKLPFPDEPLFPERPTAEAGIAGPERGPSGDVPPRPELERPGRTEDGPTAATDDLPPLVHTVSEGDTLIGIVRGYLGPGADWTEVASRNGLEPPYLLRVGRRIELASARVATTRASLAPAPRREAPSLDVNPPPEGAFLPPERGLDLDHPVLEAFPWGVPAAAGLAFAAVLLAAGAYTARGLPGAPGLARVAGPLGWGAACASGFAMIAGGAVTLGARALAESFALRLLAAAAGGAGAGASAYLGVRMSGRARDDDGPGGRPPLSEEARRRLAFRFGAATAAGIALLTGAFEATGWAARAFASLALP
jgi:hypothetical protein